MIQSLKRLWKALRRSTPDEAGSATITPNEQVARFIYDKTAWSRQQATPKPKPKVFYPMKEAGQWETSVCRIHSASEERIWKIANSARSPLLALGRADLSVYSIQNVGLQTCPAPDLEADYPEHAVIVGWPDEKDKQMELAVQLAISASLVLVSKTVSTC
jgi:hypothetical protein